MSEPKINQRIIGLDILRIILALMVVSIHLIWGDKALGNSAYAGGMDLFFVPFFALCYPAVNTYVLISGYFSYAKKKTMSQILRSLLRLWLCLVFAQLLGYMVILITHCESFSILALVKHFFPLTRGIWWYMSVYFVLMLISPALNGVLDQLSRKEYIIVMVVALLICSVIPFFTKYESPLGLNRGSGGLLWFIVLYLTGGGIYKYLSDNPYYNHKQLGLLTFVGYLVLSFILAFSSQFLVRIGLESYSFYSYNFIVVYGQAVMLFLAFRQISIRNAQVSKTISSLAGLSLAAYIYHCQEDVIEHFYQYIRPFNFVDGMRLVFFFLAFVIGIYLSAITIEYFRRKLFSIGNLENKLLSIAQR